MKDQLYNLIQRFVVKNNITLHKEELKLQLLSHPSYPSLHSVTGVLDHFNIPNAALRVPTTKEVLDQVPNCFLATIESDYSETMILAEKLKSKLKITYEDSTVKTLTETEFLSQWKGIIIAIEKDENIEEKRTNLLMDKLNWVIYGFAAFVIGYFILSAPGLFAQTHFVLSITGILLSVYIVKQDLGLQSETANNFCNLSENTSCDAVLDSKGATILGLFKLSDVSIVVFSGYTLSWLLFSVNGEINFTLFYCCTALAIPFTFYSVYYQAVVVKKWCPLCLGIVGILLLQFGALFINESWATSFEFSFNSASLFLVSIIITIALWVYLKSLLKKGNSLEKLEVEHFKFKRNFSLFHTLLKEGHAVTNTQVIPGELVFGNENAPLSLILVTSPFCHYCKKAHHDIEKLLTVSGRKLNVIIRFNLRTFEKEDELYQITSQLLHIYHTKGKATCLLSLKELYKETADLKKWIEGEDIQFKASSDTILLEQQEWCASNNISFTPALYLNGKPFPKEYERTDLAYFTDDLSETLVTKISTEQLIAS